MTMNSFNEAVSMSVFCKDHPLAVFRQRLAAAGIVRATDLRRIRSNSRVRVTGTLVIVHTPPTRSGKRVMFITIEDETGLMDLVMFPNAQKKWAKPMLTCEVLTVEGKLQRTGRDGRSISIVVEKVIVPWTGLLSALKARLEENRNLVQQ
jgi:DNA polymerase III alpha subunit